MSGEKTALTAKKIELENQISLMKHTMALTESKAQDLEVSKTKVLADQSTVGKELSKIAEERAKMEQDQKSANEQQAQQMREFELSVK